MKVSVHLTGEFERMAKPLAKKYKSFQNDYYTFLDNLKKNPTQGIPLGGGVYKIRMSIESKGKGKSGGARILTYRVERKQEHLDIFLLSIYEKGEIDNVSDAYIKQIVKQVKQQE